MEYCSIDYEKGYSKLKLIKSIGKPYQNYTKISCKSQNRKVFIIRIICFQPNKIKSVIKHKNKCLIKRQKIKTISESFH